MPFEVFEREYDVRTNIIKVRIDYFIDNPDPFGDDPYLRFDLINLADFEQGFDDEDALVFYPNKMKFTFEDLSKRNFGILKKSISTNEYSLPYNKAKYGGVSFWVNGEIIFSGYIDLKTLDYVEEEREITFEAIDKSVALKDMPVDRQTNTNEIVSIGFLVYAIYKQVYQNLQNQLYDNLFFDNGLYIKHDWKFTGRRIYPAGEITKDWSNASDFATTFFNLESVNIYGDNRNAKNYSDLLKLLALQFGMIIGNLTPTKIFMVKRFGLINPDIEIIDDKLLLDFERGIHLQPLAGVRNKNIWNGERWYSAGNIQTLNGSVTGELRYPDAVKDMTTYIGSYVDATISGTAIYTGSHEYPVFDGIQDPTLGSDKKHIAQIICDWEYGVRQTAKERFSGTLDGTNYSLTKFYKIQSVLERPIVYRPIKIGKDYVSDKTKMIGVQYV